MLFKPVPLPFLTFPLLGFLIGCTSATQETVSPVSATCRAAQFESLLWKPESALKEVSLPAGTRIIYPDQTVTMDYRPTRMNISIGKLNRIEKVYCG